MSFGFLHLAPALPDFLAAYPELTVDVMMSDRFVDLVEEGFDLAVRIGRLTESSMIAKKTVPHSSRHLRQPRLSDTPWRTQNTPGSAQPSMSLQ